MSDYRETHTFIWDRSEIYKSRSVCGDYTFVVSDSHVKCNRALIRVSSKFFNDLFATDNDIFELNSSLLLRDISADLFELIIAYIYGCKINFSLLSWSQLLELLERSHAIGLRRMSKLVAQVIEARITPETVYAIINYSSHCQLSRLTELCLQFIAANAHQLFSSDQFLACLTDKQLIFLLQAYGSNLYIEEMVVFRAVERWFQLHPTISTFNSRRQIYKACIWLENISPEDFDNQFQSTVAFAVHQFDQLMVAADGNGEGRARKERQTDVNFAENARIIGGTNAHRLSRKVGATAGEERECAYAEIGDRNPFVIDFLTPKLVNFILVHLKDSPNAITLDYNSFSYYVDISLDGDHWTRVADHQRAVCRSTQKIYFADREVRFVKVVGTAVYDKLDISHQQTIILIRSISCQLVDHDFDISRPFWTPVDNMARSDCGAAVAHGLHSVSAGDEEAIEEWLISSRNLRDDRYTYHRINKRKSQYILVHFPQPIYQSKLGVNPLNGPYRYDVSVASFVPFEYSAMINSVEDVWIGGNNEHQLTSIVKLKASSPVNELFRCQRLICPFA